MGSVPGVCVQRQNRAKLGTPPPQHCQSLPSPFPKPGKQGKLTGHVDGGGNKEMASGGFPWLSTYLSPPNPYKVAIANLHHLWQTKCECFWRFGSNTIKPIQPMLKCKGECCSSVWEQLLCMQKVQSRARAERELRLMPWRASARQHRQITELDGLSIRLCRSYFQV